MAVRNDVTVNFQLSPRVATVAAPSTSITVQDVHDTLSRIQDSIEGQQYPNLITSAGGESLGGGVAVGLTSTLQNCQLAFEKRVVQREVGTVTTPDAAGFVLTDSAATFITNGVQKGDSVRNHTDIGSVATVLTIDSETQITTDGLVGGVDNQFDSSDNYDVVAEVQCNISGGNLVAVDDVGAEIDPVFATFGTQIVRTSSSSATIADLQITNLQYLIETLRDEHRAFGEIYYWDPLNGDDSFTGDSPTRGFKTFAAAHAAVTDNASDVIFILNNSGEQLTITERITIAKNDLILRGPGPNILFQPTDDTGPTIKILNAESVSLSGFKAVTTGVTPQDVIECDGCSALSIKNVWISESTGDGIHLGGEDCIVENCTIENCAGDGLHLHDTINAKVFDNRIQRNTGWGAMLMENEGETHRDTWFRRNAFHHNGPGGINIGSGVSMTIIELDNSFGPSIFAANGDIIQNNGSGTHDYYTEYHTKIQSMLKRFGLDSDDPFTFGANQYSSASGDIVVDVTGDGKTSTTLTRQ